MRCLLAADLHYDLRKFDWILSAAGHVDLVILAGDHLDIASHVDRAAQAVVVQKYFRRIRERAPLMICSGNHDLDHIDGRGEMVTRWIGKARHFDIVTDGQSRLFGDTLFTICPWSDGRVSQREIAARLEADAGHSAGRWVWVHHAPPRGSAVSWNGRRCFGDDVLTDWIERYQPDLVFSGHVHQSPFTAKGSWADRIGATWIFNAGHQIGPMPSHVILDTDMPGAFWFSMAGAEYASLDVEPSGAFPAVEDPPAWLIEMVRQAAPMVGESRPPDRG